MNRNEIENLLHRAESAEHFPAGCLGRETVASLCRAALAGANDVAILCDSLRATLREQSDELGGALTVNEVIELIDAAEQAMREANKQPQRAALAGEWQDISTAPQGVSVLLAYEGGEPIEVGQGRIDRGTVWISERCSYLPSRFRVLGWQPLPQPPEVKP